MRENLKLSDYGIQVILNLNNNKSDLKNSNTQKFYLANST